MQTMDVQWHDIPAAYIQLYMHLHLHLQSDEKSISPLLPIRIIRVVVHSPPSRIDAPRLLEIPYHRVAGVEL